MIYLTTKRITLILFFLQIILGEEIAVCLDYKISGKVATYIRGNKRYLQGAVVAFSNCGGFSVSDDSGAFSLNLSKEDKLKRVNLLVHHQDYLPFVMHIVMSEIKENELSLGEIILKLPDSDSHRSLQTTLRDTTNFKISGRIVNSSNKNSVPNVSIYFSDASLHDFSSEVGQFKFALTNNELDGLADPFYLIFERIGFYPSIYEIEKKKAVSEKEIIIELEEFVPYSQFDELKSRFNQTANSLISLQKMITNEDKYKQLEIEFLQDYKKTIDNTLFQMTLLERSIFETYKRNQENIIDSLKNQGSRFSQFGIKMDSLIESNKSSIDALLRINENTNSHKIILQENAVKYLNLMQNHLDANKNNLLLIKTIYDSLTNNNLSSIAKDVSKNNKRLEVLLKNQNLELFETDYSCKTQLKFDIFYLPIGYFGMNSPDEIQRSLLGITCWFEPKNYFSFTWLPINMYKNGSIFTINSALGKSFFNPINFSIGFGLCSRGDNIDPCISVPILIDVGTFKNITISSFFLINETLIFINRKYKYTFDYLGVGASFSIKPFLKQQSSRL